MNDQRSLDAQLKELYNLANANGLYDAADYLKDARKQSDRNPIKGLRKAVRELVDNLGIGRGGEWTSDMVASALVDNGHVVTSTFVRIDVLRQVVRWAVDNGLVESVVAEKPDPKPNQEAFKLVFPDLLPSEVELANALLEEGYRCGAKAPRLGKP